MDTNKTAKYYSTVGSYDGLIRVSAYKWVRVKDLNKVDKTGWVRWQGPPTPAMEKALKISGPVLSADELFPNRKIN